MMCLSRLMRDSSIEREKHYTDCVNCKSSIFKCSTLLTTYYSLILRLHYRSGPNRAVLALLYKPCWPGLAQLTSMEAQKDTPMSGPNIARYRTPGSYGIGPGVRYRTMFGPDIGVSFWASIHFSSV